MSKYAHSKAKIGGLALHRPADDPELVEARRQYKADLLADRITEALESWPPLTPAQREEMARLLTDGAK
ncbi:hypothetical protein ACFVWT_04140 [Arthrobacter sp. NPDC058288]|uniref:hypothetical protein n=1 Tax=Arthrobacter sp. NPDC058288 TaxID=3346424 RepID=UPI0036E42693